MIDLRNKDTRRSVLIALPTALAGMTLLFAYGGTGVALGGLLLAISWRIA